MDLDSVLLQLSEAQLLRRTDDPEQSFLFKHTLTQETSYQSLLLKRRREIHLRVAQAIEELYPDRLDEFAALLSQHYAEAGNDAKTLEYATRAGDAAARVYANAEAIAQYTRALQVAKRAPAAREQTIHLYKSRGRTLELSSQYPRAIANYQEMQSEGRASGSPALELEALIELAKVYAVPSPYQDLAQAEAAAAQSLDLARELGDQKAQAKILWNLMLRNLFGGGDVAQAIAYGEQSLALARRLNLREQLAYTLNDLASAYWGIGNITRAREVQEEARELWIELGNLPMLADNLTTFTFTRFALGDYEGAIWFSEEAFRVSHSIGNLWGEANSRFMVGQVYLERGEFGKAIEVMEQGIHQSEITGNPGVRIGTRSDLAWAYAMLGRVDHAFELVQTALDSIGHMPIIRSWPLAILTRLHVLRGELDAAEESLRASYGDLRAIGSLYSYIWVLIADGELADARGDYARVVQVTQRLYEHLVNIQTRPFRTDALYLQARAIMQMGQIEEAQALLADARAQAEELGSRRTLWPILVALGEIESARGNVEEADKLRARAREILEFIAEHISAAELRASFLNQPSVRQVFNQAPS